MRHFWSFSCSVNEIRHFHAVQVCVFFLKVKIRIFIVRVFFRATHWDNLVLELLTRLTMTLPSDLLHDLVVIVDHEWKQ